MLWLRNEYCANYVQVLCLFYGISYLHSTVTTSTHSATPPQTCIASAKEGGGKCCENVVRMLCVFVQHSVHLPRTFYSFSPQLPLPLVLSHASLVLRRVAGQLRGCGVRMLCLFCARFCAQFYAFFCYILQLLSSTPSDTPAQPLLDSAR